MTTSNVSKCLLVVFSYFTTSFLLVEGSVKVTTPLPSTILGNKTKDSGDSLEFRLTKLLDVHLGGESTQMKSYLRSIIFEEVQKTFKVFEAEVKNGIGQPLRAEHLESDNTGKETLLMLLDNLAKEVQNTRNAIMEVKADYDWLKKNVISNATLSGHNSDISARTCFVSNTLTGVDYNPKDVIAALPEELTKKNIPKNCREVQENGYNVSGIYEVQPRKSEKSFMVLCDMETRGGGWTHIQKRYDGSQDFFLNWREYKFGFGILEGEFWLGLQNIYLLTAFEVNELLVELVDRDNVKATAHYEAFGIGAETEGYPLNVLRGFTGDAGDSLTQHLGAKFSTKDFDQDEHAGNCAQLYSGAWWYKKCHSSNLNGKFINVDIPKQYVHQGMHWLTFRNHEYCHSKSRMLVRPVGKY